RPKPKRVANGKHPIANLNLTGVSDRDMPQLGVVYLDDGQIGGRMLAAAAGPICALVLQGNGYLTSFCIGDHMVVGEDVPVVRDEHSRPSDSHPPSGHEPVPKVLVAAAAMVFVVRHGHTILDNACFDE